MATATKREVTATIDSIKEHFGNDLEGKTITVWGLTSSLDINEACNTPGMRLVDWLLEQGATVRVHAPNVFCESPDAYGADLQFESGHWNALRKADALVVLSDSDRYRGADAGWLRWHLRQAVIFDCKNCLNTEPMQYGSFAYYGVEPERVPVFCSIDFEEAKAALTGKSNVQSRCNVAA